MLLANGYLLLVSLVPFRAKIERRAHSNDGLQRIHLLVGVLQDLATLNLGHFHINETVWSAWR